MEFDNAVDRSVVRVVERPIALGGARSSSITRMSVRVIATT